MTTVAWDGSVLAADRLNSMGNLIGDCQKIFRINHNTIFGGSGSYQDCLAIRDWLCGDMKGEKPKIDSDEGFTGILVEANKAFRLDSKLIKYELTCTFHAVGSGRDFAITAMHLGQSSYEAIKTTAIFDLYTNDKVDTLACKELVWKDDDIPF